MIKTYYFDAIDSEEKAYWLGFICADGHIYKSLKQISIILSSKDKEHLAKLAEIFSRPLEIASFLINEHKKCMKVFGLCLTAKICVQTSSAKGFHSRKPNFSMAPFLRTYQRT